VCARMGIRIFFFFLFSACNLLDKTGIHYRAYVRSGCARPPVFFPHVAFPFILPYRYSSALLLPSFLARLVSVSLSLALAGRSVDFPSCFAARLLPTKDHGKNALARPAGLVARLILDPMAADVEATTRVLRTRPKSLVKSRWRNDKRENLPCEIAFTRAVLPFRASIPLEKFA